jgi:hypothetical protein
VKLFEVMNTKIQAEWKIHGSEHVSASFEIDGITIQVDFEYLTNNSYNPEARGVITPKKAWGITFRAIDPEKRSTVGTFGKTGGGNEFKIFPAVGNIVFDFIKKHNNPPIFFSAEEENRIRLYERFARKLRTIGYVIVTDHEDAMGSKEWVYAHESTQRGDVNEATDYTKQQQKHSTLKLLNMLDKKDFGKPVKTKTSDALVKDSKTKTIYGRRAVVQRDL